MDNGKHEDDILANLDKQLAASGPAEPQPIKDRMTDPEIFDKLNEAAGAEAFMVAVWHINPKDGKLQINLFTKCSRNYPIDDLHESAAMLYRDFNNRVKKHKAAIREIEPPAGIQDEE